MKIEVDQSGKIEQTKFDTIIAFSNKYQYATLLSAKIKRELIFEYKEDKQIILKLFVICLYYTIKDYLNEAELIVIDNEYEGKQNYIKSSLLNLIRKSKPSFSKKLIKISNITKLSKAHEVALSVQRGHIKPQKTLLEKEIKAMIWGART